MPSAVGVNSQRCKRNGGILEQYTSHDQGDRSHGAGQLLPADDYNTSGAATALPTWMRRRICRGDRLNSDPLHGPSRPVPFSFPILDPRVVGAEHYAVARARQLVAGRN